MRSGHQLLSGESGTEDAIACPLILSLDVDFFIDLQAEKTS